MSGQRDACCMHCLCVLCGKHGHDGYGADRSPLPEWVESWCNGDEGVVMVMMWIGG